MLLSETWRYVMAAGIASAVTGVVRIVCLWIRVRFARYVIDVARDQKRPIDPVEIFNAVAPKSLHDLHGVRRPRMGGVLVGSAWEEHTRPQDGSVPRPGSSGPGCPVAGEPWDPKRRPSDADCS